MSSSLRKTHALTTRRRPKTGRRGLSAYETRVPRGPNMAPVAQRMRTKLRYAESFSYGTGAVGAYQEYLFNLNSLHDPNRTGTGHQPLGYDQLSAFYNRWRVESVRITLFVEATSQSTTTQQISMCATNSTGVLSTCADALEHPYGKMVQIYPGGGAEILDMSIPLWVLTGQLRSAYDADDSYQAQTGASPTELLILHIGFDNPVGVAAYDLWTVLIEFDSEFWDPVQLGQS
jgi:hypothetical protein